MPRRDVGSQASITIRAEPVTIPRARVTRRRGTAWDAANDAKDAATPLFDYLKVYRRNVEPHLAPGERLIALTPFQLAAGARRLERTREDMERQFAMLPPALRDRIYALEQSDQSDRSRSFTDHVIDAITGSPDLPWSRIDFDAKLSGVTAEGHVGSIAYRIVEFCDRNSGLFAVVTDRRMLFLRNAGNQEFKLHYEIPRPAVVEASRRGKLFQRGRVVVAFADLSKVALMTGFFSTARARQLISALSGRLQ